MPALPFDNIELKIDEPRCCKLTHGVLNAHRSPPVQGVPVTWTRAHPEVARFKVLTLYPGYDRSCGGAPGKRRGQVESPKPVEMLIQGGYEIHKSLKFTFSVTFHYVLGIGFLEGR